MKKISKPKLVPPVGVRLKTWRKWSPQARAMYISMMGDYDRNFASLVKLCPHLSGLEIATAAVHNMAFMAADQMSKRARK